VAGIGPVEDASEGERRYSAPMTVRGENIIREKEGGGKINDKVK
jgi:hypothetical protein